MYHSHINTIHSSALKFIMSLYVNMYAQLYSLDKGVAFMQLKIYANNNNCGVCKITFDSSKCAKISTETCVGFVRLYICC